MNESSLLPRDTRCVTWRTWAPRSILHTVHTGSERIHFTVLKQLLWARKQLAMCHFSKQSRHCVLIQQSKIVPKQINFSILFDCVKNITMPRCLGARTDGFGAQSLKVAGTLFGVFLMEFAYSPVDGKYDINKCLRFIAICWKREFALEGDFCSW